MPERTVNLSSAGYAPAKKREQPGNLTTPPLEKPRDTLVLPPMPSTTRKADHTLAVESAPSAKKFINWKRFIPSSKKREREVGLLKPPPRLVVKERELRTFFPFKKRFASRQLDGVLSPPHRSVQKQLTDNLPATRLVAENLPSAHFTLAERTVTATFSHNLSTEFKPIKCMQLCIDNEKDSRLPTSLFTIAAKGEKDQPDGGQNPRDIIHFKLHAQPHGGRFTEVILKVEFAHPVSDETIPIASFTPDQKDLDTVHVEYERTHGGSIGLAAGIQHAGVNVAGNMNELRRYAQEEPAAVINGVCFDDSIRWHVKAGPKNSQGLSNPLYVQLSIQMTSEVKARLRLSCQYKGEGLLNRMSRPKMHQLPHEGSGSMEVLLVGMTESPKISDDSLVGLNLPGALDCDNKEVHHWHYFIIFCICVYFAQFH